MSQRVEAAIFEKNQIRQKEMEVKVKQDDHQSEEELNSNDDISDYNEDFNCGDNILLGFYVRSKRKRDKRKIHFKNCVLRVDGKEQLVPNAKGEFLWAQSARGR